MWDLGQPAKLLSHAAFAVNMPRIITKHNLTHCVPDQDFSVSGAQRLAHAAFGDGLLLDGVRELSELGCSGSYLNNAERDFHRRFAPNLPFDIKPWWIRVPLMTQRGDTQEVTDSFFPCYAPHEMLALLHGPPPSMLFALAPTKQQLLVPCVPGPPSPETEVPAIPSSNAMCWAVRRITWTHFGKHCALQEQNGW